MLSAARNASNAIRQGRGFAQGAGTLKAINPFTGGVAWEEAAMTAQEGQNAIASATSAFSTWRKTPVSKRSEILRHCSQTLRNRADEFAVVMATEMGKRIVEGRAEVLKCCTVVDYYAEHAERFLEPEHIDLGVTRSYVSKQPLGLVLLIMPWNFPFWQVFRQCSAALAAGNVCALKHASNVPRCARLIEEVVQDACKASGISPEVFINLPVRGRDMDAIIEDPRVRAVSLTGSTPVGSRIGAMAGKCLKPSVLELGGNDPHIILEDADVAKAAEACVTGRLLNAGQSCIGAKRFIAVDQVYDKFLDSFCDLMSAHTLGDPLQEGTKLGPLVSHDSRDEIHDQVLKTIEAGARTVIGGAPLQHPGAMYPATVLAEVPAGSVGYCDEIFGPVASVIRAKDEKEAIEIANSSIFGLGAAVYTEDVERGERIAREELQAGLCFVNDFVKSDPRMPFGGIKQSGYGRECSKYGIDAFVNVKSVVVK